jgi:uncharacterized protein
VSPRPGRALITGASSGIGAALSRELAALDWDLILTARSMDRLESLAEELSSAFGVEVLVLAEDLSEIAAPRRIEEATEGQGLAVDLLINNAGFGALGPFTESEPEVQRAMIQVNVTAVSELCRRFIPHMAARGRGRILNVASTAAFQPGPLMALYYATKAAVLSLSEGLRVEVAPLGVTVTTLCPGVTASEFHTRAGMRTDAALLGRMPMATAESVARLGVQATLRGRGIVIPGRLNQSLAFVAVRLLPKRWVPHLVHAIQRKRG